MLRRTFLGGLGALVLATQLPRIAKAEAKTSQVNTETLETAVQTYEIQFKDENEKQRFIAGYNPQKDYKAEYQKTSNSIANLDMVKYAGEHAIAEFVWRYEELSGEFERDKDKDLRNLKTSHFNLWKSKKPIVNDGVVWNQFEKRIIELSSTSKFCRGIENYCRKEIEEKNQMFYLASYLAEQLRQGLINQNREWTAKPWIGPKYRPETKRSDKKPNPLNKKGEFVFYGDEWCRPCNELAELLHTSKIKFKEENDGMPNTPHVYFGENYYCGLDSINEIIEKMYGLKIEK